MEESAFYDNRFTDRTIDEFVYDNTIQIGVQI